MQRRKAFIAAALVAAALLLGGAIWVARDPEVVLRGEFARLRWQAGLRPGAVQAAGPRLALAGGGGKGVVSGVTHPGPAEPSRSLVALRAPRVSGRAPPER